MFFLKNSKQRQKLSSLNIVLRYHSLYITSSSWEDGAKINMHCAIRLHVNLDTYCLYLHVYCYSFITFWCIKTHIRISVFITDLCVRMVSLIYDAKSPQTQTEVSTAQLIINTFSLHLIVNTFRALCSYLYIL